MKKILALVFLVCATQFLKAEDKYTNFVFTGGAYLNGTMYSSNFSALPGNKPILVSFDKAFGLSPAFSLGFEYLFENKIFNLNARYGLKGIYQSLSAKFEKEEFIGYYIDGASYSKAYSNHILDPKINAFILEQYLSLYPIDDKLSVNLGLQVGFPVSKEYTQSEDLKTPSSVTFETLNRQRNLYSGTIQNASSFYSAISIGAKYELYDLGAFKVVPELQFNYGLTNLVKDLDWKASSVRLGVCINYRLPEYVPPPPAPAAKPPMPELQLPPKSVFEMNTMALMNNGKELKSGDEITVPIEIFEKAERFAVRPIIYFEKNSTDFVKSDIKSVNGYKIGDYSLIIKLIASEYKISKSAVHVFINAPNDENTDIAEQRVEKIKSLLVEAGIDKSKIICEIVPIKLKKKYTQIDDESRNVTIKTENSLAIFDNTISSDKKFTNVELKTGAKVNSSSNKFEINTKAEILNKVILDSKEANNNIVIKPEEYNYDKLKTGSNLSINITGKDIEGDTKSNIIDVTVKAKEIKKTVVYNEIELGQRYILGYFNYDEKEFSEVDEYVAALVKKAVAENKKVTIYPGTDNLGAEKYNYALAKARANAAIKLLDIDKNSYRIEKLPEDYLYANDNPVGRSLNRCVVVIIEK